MDEYTRIIREAFPPERANQILAREKQFPARRRVGTEFDRTSTATSVVQHINIFTAAPARNTWSITRLILTAIAAIWSL